MDSDTKQSISWATTIDSGMIDTCWQLVGIVETGLYHSMADVQSMVSQTVDLLLALTDLTFFLV